MKSITLFRNIVLLSIFSTGITWAQTIPPIEFFYEVTTVVMDDSEAVEQRLVMNMMEDVLQSRGGQASEKEGWLFLVGIKQKEDLDYVALSVTTLHKLPEPIVELGKREEAFYLIMPKEKKVALPEEGKFIREHVSEGYMRQFADIQGNYIELASKEDLKEVMEGIVGRFISRHLMRTEE